MPSHASHTRGRRRPLAIAAAVLACALVPTSADAVEISVAPEATLPAVPAAPSTDLEGEIHSSSIVRLSPALSVQSARIRRGRLAISGRLRRGVTGKVRGVARYRGHAHRFATLVDDSGRISIQRRLPGAKEARSARVTLVYGGSLRFHRERMKLKATRPSQKAATPRFDGRASRSRSA